jgi:hypothetical protein
MGHFWPKLHPNPLKFTPFRRERHATNYGSNFSVILIVCHFFADEFATFVFCLPFDCSPRQPLLFGRPHIAFNVGKRLMFGDGHDLACRTTGLSKSASRRGLVLVALALDNSRLSGVLEMKANDQCAASNKDCDLRPRPVRILFERVAGQIGEASGI